MKKAMIGLAAGAALTLSAGTAMADGYGDGSVNDMAPMAVPQANWNGLYIGAAVGYGIASTEFTLGLDQLGSASLDGISSDGFQGVVTLGYDRQIHSNLVFGVFADYAFGDLESDLSISLDPQLQIASGEVLKAEIADNWSIGARLGLVRSCCTMWYLSAGYSQADYELGAGELLGGGSISKTLNGYFIGGGVEQQLRDNLFLKLDYRYTDYDKERLAGSAQDLYLDTETDVHSIRLGINWKVDLFGGHRAAPVPTYEPLK